MPTAQPHQTTTATPERTTDLFVLEDLDDEERTSTLAPSQLHALRAVADWMTTFVAQPNEELGRAGPVCPFVPGALEAKTLWLAPEQVADRGIEDTVRLIDSYKRVFLTAPPVAGDGVDNKAIVVVFTDLSPDRAEGFFDEVQRHLQVSSYVEDGLVLGTFYASNNGTAIYNAHFRPFRSPVPFLLMRHAVIGDWKFFLDDEAWLDRWARRFGASAVEAVADELRRLPWRARRD